MNGKSETDMHRKFEGFDFERFFLRFTVIIVIVLMAISASAVMMYPSTMIVFLAMGLLFFLWLIIARKADRIIKRKIWRLLIIMRNLINFGGKSGQV